MASNIWAEMISIGGWTLLLGFLIVFIAVIALGQRFLRLPNLGTRAAVALAMSYWVFYIHRNELSYQLNLEKRVLMVWAFCTVGSMMLAGRSRRAPTRSLALSGRIG